MCSINTVGAGRCEAAKNVPAMTSPSSVENWSGTVTSVAAGVGVIVTSGSDALNWPAPGVKFSSPMFPPTSVTTVGGTGATVLLAAMITRVGVSGSGVSSGGTSHAVAIRTSTTRTDAITLSLTRKVFLQTDRDLYSEGDVPSPQAAWGEVSFTVN